MLAVSDPASAAGAALTVSPMSGRAGATFVLTYMAPTNVCAAGAQESIVFTWGVAGPQSGTTLASTPCVSRQFQYTAGPLAPPSNAPGSYTVWAYETEGTGPDNGSAASTSYTISAPATTTTAPTTTAVGAGANSTLPGTPTSAVSAPTSSTAVPAAGSGAAGGSGTVRSGGAPSTVASPSPPTSGTGWWTRWPAVAGGAAALVVAGLVVGEIRRRRGPSPAVHPAVSADNFFRYPGLPDDEVGPEFLASWSSRDWTELLRHSDIRRYPAGSRILSPDRPDKALYLVIRGRVDALPAADTAVPGGVRTFYPGSVFGEGGFLGGLEPLGVMTAAEDVEVLHLSSERFDALASKDPALGRALLRELGTALVRQLRHSSTPGGVGVS